MLAADLTLLSPGVINHDSSTSATLFGITADGAEVLITTAAARVGADPLEGEPFHKNVYLRKVALDNTVAAYEFVGEEGFGGPAISANGRYLAEVIPGGTAPLDTWTLPLGVEYFFHGERITPEGNLPGGFYGSDGSYYATYFDIPQASGVSNYRLAAIRLTDLQTNLSVTFSVDDTLDVYATAVSDQGDVSYFGRQVEIREVESPFDTARFSIAPAGIRGATYSYHSTIAYEGDGPLIISANGAALAAQIGVNILHTDLILGESKVIDPVNTVITPPAPFLADISDNGRFIVFVSDRSDLVDGDTNGKADVFRYDSNDVDSPLTIVSRNLNGALSDGDSLSASISDDGRFVAFSSYATNLTTDARFPNKSNVFVKDLLTGRVLMAAAYSSNDSYSPLISGNGAYVAFVNGGAAAGALFTNVYGFSNSLSANLPPVVDQPLADTFVFQDAAFSYTVPATTFSDLDETAGLRVSVSLASGDPLPAWLVFDPATGEFSGTPGSGDAGTISIEVTATDSAFDSVSDTFDLTVVAPHITIIEGRALVGAQPAFFGVRYFPDVRQDLWTYRWTLTRTSDGVVAAVGADPYFLFDDASLGAAADRYELTVNTSDDYGRTGTDSIAFTVDRTAPTVTSFAKSPATGTVESLSVQFSEIVQDFVQSNSAFGGFSLTGAGADNEFGTRDDLMSIPLTVAMRDGLVGPPPAGVSVLPATGQNAEIAFASSLTPGLYRLRVSGRLRDIAGNPLNGAGAGGVNGPGGQFGGGSDSTFDFTSGLDAPTTVRFLNSPGKTSEGGTASLVYQVTRKGSYTGPLTVGFSASGTASAGDDYAVRGDGVTFDAETLTGRVHFPDGVLAVEILVDPIDDDTVEAAETVKLVLASDAIDAPFSITGTGNRTGTILNDDNAIQSFSIQGGNAQRSFIRKLEINLSNELGLADVVTNKADRIRLTKFDLNGENGVQVMLGKVSKGRSSLKFDFGREGIGATDLTGAGANRNTNAADGYYELSVDLDGDGFHESVRHFFRLYGDVNGETRGDAAVDAVDEELWRDAATEAARLGETLDLNYDIDGNGRANSLDFIAVQAASSRRPTLAPGLRIDEAIVRRIPGIN